jgi:hypothetical protein
MLDIIVKMIKSFVFSRKAPDKVSTAFLYIISMLSTTSAGLLIFTCINNWKFSGEILGLILGLVLMAVVMYPKILFSASFRLLYGAVFFIAVESM